MRELHELDGWEGGEVSLGGGMGRGGIAVGN